MSLPLRELLLEPAHRVAEALVGARLERAHTDGTRVVAEIVETEAYRQDDPASHSARGRTLRTEVMFGPPGRLYVYRSHGLHWCMNVVCEEAGVGAAVLLRAARVIDGVEEVRHRRPGRSDRQLLRGPGNLCAGLGVDDRHRGVDVLVDGPLRLAAASTERRLVQRGPRVGVSRAADLAWRFWLDGAPEVSAYRRSPRAPRA